MTSKRGISGLALLLLVAASGLVAAPGAALAAPAKATGGALQTVGLAGWQVQSAAPTTTWTTGTGATQSAADISDPAFDPSGWLRVTPDDGGAVGTEVEALVQNGICPDDAALQPINQRTGDPKSIYYSTNMQSCFGPPATNAGANTNPLFNVPWWFRTTFTGSARDNTRLVINGVVGQADVWINGTEVATQATVTGDLASYSFDVSHLLHGGTNALAFEVFPNNPSTMLTLDDVDWNQIPPDNNTGIQFPVQLHTSGTVGATNAYVTQNDSPDLSTATLTAHVDATNNTTKDQRTTVRAVIAPPGGAPISVTRNVTLAPGATRSVTFDPVVIRHPQLWWPYQMGGQPLYTLRASVGDDAAAPVEFGVRTVTSYLTAASAQAPQGVRVFEINGVPFEVRGGGWAENLFLHYSSADLDNQLTLVKSMGINTIRTEGKEMPQDFYESMDRAGIMLDPGFQCCDKWQPSSSGRGVTAQDFHIMYASSLAIGERLRDHPSVTSFGWSDNTPINEQEVASIQGFAAAGFQEPLISSAEYKASGVLGPAGEKEGPYDWEPPDYWFDTTHSSNSGVDNDSSQTNVGGSWGFDSEQGSGDTVPTTDSLDRFMSPADQATLWQQPDAHQYHTNYESTAGEHNGYDFGTLNNLDTAIQGRYGAWNGLQQYVQEAQVQNYESTRAQFEAYLDHWNNYPTPSTGTIYWQMNKGWPSLLWNLYNNDYDEAGAYFGAKKANENLHVLYAPDDGTVTVDNLTGVTQPGLTVEARVRDLTGKVLDTQTSKGFALPTQGVGNRILTPKTPAATQVYFVELVLRQNGKVVDRNVYWRSTRPDVVDWASTEGSPQANNGDPLSQYMDMSALKSLPSTNLSVSASTSPRPDRDGELTTTITVANPSANTAVGFFTRADVRRGNADGSPQSGDNEVLPVDWSDNDITLWPGQSETLTATYAASQLRGTTPLVTLGGWNVPERTVVAGGTRAPSPSSFGTAAGHPLVTGSATAGPGAPFHSPDTSQHAATGLAWTVTSATTGAFTQGDAADAYTLTVTNTGKAATDGTTPVVVTDVLDPGAGLVSLAGTGWTCDTSNAPTLTCTRADVLPPGQAYPPLTLTEKLGARAGFGTQDSNAGPHVTNSVAVTGGAASKPSASIARETPVAGVPNLTADNAVDGAFRQGDASDRYEITVINQGGAATTGAPIVAKVTPPAGETVTALYGSGWTCDLTSCSRTDPLPGNNGEAPPITVVVSVAPNAPATGNETVVVSGGGETAAAASVAAATTIAASAPANPAGTLTVTSDHLGSFAQSDQSDPITLTVSNPATAGTSTGPVTVTDSPPAGLVPVRIGGPGWTCRLAPATLPGPVNTFASAPSCSRSDDLAPGASYPPITMTVAVANNAQPQVTNLATVNGNPGSAAITIVQRPRLAVTGVPVAGGIRYAPFTSTGQYSVLVANEGFAPTEGPVTVTVDVPAGLTPTAIAGTGWTCRAATATCTTRPGVTLAAGAQSTITLNVAVSRHAPQSVETAVQATGGGQAVHRPTNHYDTLGNGGSYVIPTYITAH